MKVYIRSTLGQQGKAQKLSLKASDPANGA
jgi:hypothetical protein